jgi:branched-chain amino acid transport system ATP-binding protein
MDLIARLCRHVFVLAAGRMLFEGTPKAAITDPQVIEAYLGTGSS